MWAIRMFISLIEVLYLRYNDAAHPMSKVDQEGSMMNLSHAIKVPSKTPRLPLQKRKKDHPENSTLSLQSRKHNRKTPRPLTHRHFIKSSSHQVDLS